MHRPDFISSSGERQKRLKLLVEERKLQGVFQGERERLFNPPDGMSCRNAGGLVNRGTPSPTWGALLQIACGVRLLKK